MRSTDHGPARSKRIEKAHPSSALAVAAAVMLQVAGSPAMAESEADSGPAAAPATPAATTVKVRALADVDRIIPGSTFHLAFVFDVPDHWHVYWKNPGAGAAPTEVRVTAPAGYTVGPIQWPRPLVVPSEVGDVYGYEDQTVLFVPVTAPVELTDGRVEFSADLSWAVCRDVCRFERASLSVKLPAHHAASTVTASLDPVLARFRARLPQPLEKLDGASIRFDGTTLTIDVPLGEHKSLRLIPNPSPGVTFEEGKTTIDGGRGRLVVPVTIKPENSLGQPPMLRGLVALDDGPSDPCYEFARPVKSASADAGH